MCISLRRVLGDISRETLARHLIKFFFAQRVMVKHSELNRITLTSQYIVGVSRVGSLALYRAGYMGPLPARCVIDARAPGLNGWQYQSGRLPLGRNIASRLLLSITDWKYFGSVSSRTDTYRANLGHFNRVRTLRDDRLISTYKDTTYLSLRSLLMQSTSKSPGKYVNCTGYSVDSRVRQTCSP